MIALPGPNALACGCRPSGASRSGDYFDRLEDIYERAGTPIASTLLVYTCRRVFCSRCDFRGLVGFGGDTWVGRPAEPRRPSNDTLNLGDSRAPGHPHADEFQPLVEDLIRKLGAKAVCEVGGGALPMLSRDCVSSHALRYLVIDVSAEELDKAPRHVDTLVTDISDPGARPPGGFDLVITRWVREHVEVPGRFHTGVRRLLRPGGRAVHLFPTLYSLPFVVNRLLPETVSARVLKKSGCADREQGKFPAYYRWCRGPSRRQIGRFERRGFLIEKYIGFCGHRYFERSPRLQRAEDRFARLLADRGAAGLTTYALVVATKMPDGDWDTKDG